MKNCVKKLLGAVAVLAAVAGFVSCSGDEITEVHYDSNEIKTNEEIEKLQKEIEELKKVLEELTASDSNQPVVGVEDIASVLAAADGSENTYVKLNSSVKAEDIPSIAETLKTNTEASVILDLGKATNLETIDSGAFKDCANLVNVILPETLKAIKSNAFDGCTELMTVTIPENMDYVEASAFNNCSGLKQVVVKNSDTYVSPDAFKNCKAIELVEGNGALIKSVDSAVDHYFDAVLIKGETSVQARYFRGLTHLNKLTISHGPKIIEEECFSGSSISEVEIPYSVTTIEDKTFNDCNSLTSITIPENVTYIGDYAFNDCNSLTSITIPENVTYIGETAFSGCSSLTSITIPENVTSIGDGAFWDCSSLTSITIPDRVTSIGDLAFSGCSSLTSITIPDRVTSIGGSAFYGCSRLTSITIPDSVRYIRYSAFYGCSLTTIYYKGTAGEWNMIYKDNPGIPSTATVIYNYKD